MLPLSPALDRIFTAALDDLMRQRDEQAARCRAAAQALIEDVGADGPMSLEQVVERTRARLAELEAKVALRNKQLARYRETVRALGSELAHIDDEARKGVRHRWCETQVSVARRHGEATHTAEFVCLDCNHFADAHSDRHDLPSDGCRFDASFDVSVLVVGE